MRSASPSTSLSPLRTTEETPGRRAVPSRVASSSGTPYDAWSFAPWFAGVIAVSGIPTPLFNASRGSLMIAYLFHFQVMNPIFPDAQPWDNLLFIIAAVIIVWLNRRTMFQHGSGVTDILMPEEGDIV